MAINGVETVTFGVSEAGTLIRFFEDFGLGKPRTAKYGADFATPEGAHVQVRTHDDPILPPQFLPGDGPREVIWGVTDDETLDRIESELKRDRDVTRDASNTLHTVDPNGIRIGFRRFVRKPIPEFHSVENSVSKPARWNTPRHWYDRATPKTIQHVVFTILDIDAAVDFYVGRLQFRVSDVSRQRGIFLRAEGRHEHHNLFFAHKEKGFHHMAFGVDSVDELMAGANYMERQGWKAGTGLGRHRISSVLYYYFKAPTGGEIEYAADTDYLDDNWQPKVWGPRYGNQHWLGHVSEANMTPPTPDVEPIPSPMPRFSEL
jgi:catechol 2,3-dioxygenase-like lactoylglutathione lyase family enzyme